MLEQSKDFEFVVKAWKVHHIPFSVTKGSTISWEWKTKNYDISFSASFQAFQQSAVLRHEKCLWKDAQDYGHALPAYPPTRVKHSEKKWQHGRLAADSDGILHLHFDNGFSKMRSKTVSVKIQVFSGNGDSDNNNSNSSESKGLNAQARFEAGMFVRTPYGLGTVELQRAHDGMYIIALDFGRAYIHPRDVRAAEGVTPRTINERAKVGVAMFMNNRIDAAEQFFQMEMKKYPVFAVSYGALGYLRAMMTWAKPDIDDAMIRLKSAQKFASAFLPRKSTGQMISGFFSGKQKQITLEEMEATLLTAETSILMAVLRLTEENLSAFVKAGLAMKYAWGYYSTCNTQLLEYEKKKSDGDTVDSMFEDESICGGVRFGVGAFNTIISILPPIILRVVSFFGFPSDRVEGMRLLNAAFDGDGVRAPLSALIMLSQHVIVPSFFSTHLSVHNHRADSILKRGLARFPESALYWWLKGRLDRNKRELDNSIAALERASRANVAWPQLQHLVAYELGWCWFYKQEYAKSIPYWQRMYEENAWSKGFYRYMLMLEALERGDTASAKQHAPVVLEEIAATRKFGGKTLSHEIFIRRRCEEYLAGDTPLLPALELTYIFNGFAQMTTELVQQAYDVTHARLQQALAVNQDDTHADYLNDIQQAKLKLMCGGALKLLGDYPSAISILKEVVDIPEKELGEDTFIVPFARYELAAIYLGANLGDEVNWYDIKNNNENNEGKEEDSDRGLSGVVNMKEGQKWLKKVKSFKRDYNFKYRLLFRVHLAHWEISQITGEKLDYSKEATEDVNTGLWSEDALRKAEAELAADDPTRNSNAATAEQKQSSS